MSIKGSLIFLLMKSAYNFNLYINGKLEFVLFDLANLMQFLPDRGIGLVVFGTDWYMYTRNI
jgi:hypothetical protein